MTLAQKFRALDPAAVPRQSRLGKAMRKSGVRSTPELERILALPSYKWQDDPEITAMGDWLVSQFGTPLRRGCMPRCGHMPLAAEGCQECDRARRTCPCQGTGTMSLRPVQVAALQAIHDHGGMIGNMRVGSGKTLVSFLAGVVTDTPRVLLLIPAKLTQKTNRDFALLKRHWQSPRRLHLMSYELLSRDRGVRELNAYKPTLIVADEAQKVKNPKAACTIRLHRYLAENPSCGYVDMSGTLTKRSLLEYHHRVMWAINDGMQPLPRQKTECRIWSEAIDEAVNPYNRRAPGGLLRLCSDPELQELAQGRSVDPLAVVREAYGRRLMSAPGMVGTTEQFDGAMPLIVAGVTLEPGPRVVDAFRKLRDTWELPCGREIETPAGLWRHTRELIQGFYYRWEPPPPVEWLIPRKVWSATVRQIIRGSRGTIETPLIATRAIDDGQYPWAREALRDWRAVRDMYKPTTTAVWLDDACLQWAGDWLDRNTGIAWTWEVEFAKRLSKETGLPYYGRGGLCGKKAIEDETGPCIASIKANAEGRNLQQYHRNLIVSCPPGGDIWEQLLGRTHRDGQCADEVECYLLLACFEQWSTFRQARRDAEYTGRTMGQAQKLNFADVLVSPETEIQQLHASGDPLWSKDNALFFEGVGEYDSEKILTDVKRTGKVI